MQAALLAAPSLDWRRIAALSATFGAHLLAAFLIAAPLALVPPRGRTLPEPLDVHLIDHEPAPIPPPPGPAPPPRPQRTRVAAPPPPVPPVKIDTAPVETAVPALPAAAVEPPAPAHAPASAPAAPDATGYGESRTLAYDGAPRLAYPPASLRAREQGTVVLRVLVDAEGVVQRIEIARSSGHAALDAAARDAVRRAHFRPVLRDGRPAPAWGLVPIDFRLDQA